MLPSAYRSLLRSLPLISFMSSSRRRSSLYVNAGIPVLVPKQPEKRRFVEAHGVGHCCDDLTPEAIAEAMQRMIDSPQWLESLKQRCREVAPSVSWQREADTYRSIYEGVYERILFADDPSPGFRPWRPIWSPA